MEEVYEMSLLLDFYGQMLTGRQFEMMDLHFNNDLSLGEIAEQLGISRQGVHDNVKRGKAILSEYEQKLSLVAKFTSQRQNAEKALDLLQSIDGEKIEPDTADKLKSIESIIFEIINAV